MSNYIEGYICRCCGKYHDELPMSYGGDVPDYYYSVPQEEQENRIEINDDLCVIDGEHFFIRGCIEIPVLDGEGPFIWDVWVSLSETNFEKTIEYWETEGRENELEPLFGWLSTSIPCYPKTINLKTMVHTRPVGVSPYIELEPTEHPLSVEQRKGITMERIKLIAEELCDEEEQ
ncbi:DUF2199 domain-containing protein [Paenibacillus sp. BSR1-1]|uniref:DUF2199 domain-containing protein n=1 Tax=Paenibacillus sp. BSR1-1 TaxID=3020845 RepID=UPI0025B15A20|nr:DUF2199 domain-containing protein [Paenibacillus sp. BSR1-1]MDN3020281.1 DUF2199 domain-containing protein [Paenibacillus sp. BSR1-1]